MACNEKPTEAQLGVIYQWFRWEMPNAEASRACRWLEDNATRRDVSLEMNRLKILKNKRTLDRDNCFAGEIWEGYR